MERKGGGIKDKLCFIPVCASQNRQKKMRKEGKQYDKKDSMFCNGIVSSADSGVWPQSTNDGICGGNG
jgi:hypothetical protein